MRIFIYFEFLLLFILFQSSRQQDYMELPPLTYEVIKQGYGKIPILTDTVKIHYEGSTTNGIVFDSSYSRGHPSTFKVSELIDGMTQALLMMPVESIWKLRIPSHLAYGEQGASPPIGPNTDLIFTVELLDIIEGSITDLVVEVQMNDGGQNEQQEPISEIGDQSEFGSITGYVNGPNGLIPIYASNSNVNTNANTNANFNVNTNDLSGSAPNVNINSLSKELPQLFQQLISLAKVQKQQHQQLAEQLEQLEQLEQQQLQLLQRLHNSYQNIPMHGNGLQMNGNELELLNFYQNMPMRGNELLMRGNELVDNYGWQNMAGNHGWQNIGGSHAWDTMGWQTSFNEQPNMNMIYPNSYPNNIFNQGVNSGRNERTERPSRGRHTTRKRANVSLVNRTQPLDNILHTFVDVIENSTIVNPTIVNPTIEKPTIENPTIENPTVENPIIENSTIENSTIETTKNKINIFPASNNRITSRQRKKDQRKKNGSKKKHHIPN